MNSYTTKASTNAKTNPKIHNIIRDTLVSFLATMSSKPYPQRKSFRHFLLKFHFLTVTTNFYRIHPLNMPKYDDILHNFINIDLSLVQDNLIEWYQLHHRKFPWRETTDAYPILVSEVMSQQTQLTRVVTAWEEFLSIWPSIESLANSHLSDVLKFWTTHRLGYNRRARFLRETAIEIVHNFNGEIPNSLDSLQKLPGIGPYTANAIASFAFNNGGPTLDTNVKRVIYRFFGPFENLSDIEQVANQIMPPNHSRIWNNAMMELGATICKPNPLCDLQACPWRTHCNAYSNQEFSIPLSPSPPSFKGSTRQIRGEIINILSKTDVLSISDLDSKLTSSMPPEYNSDLLPKLLHTLESEGLIQINKLKEPPTVQLHP